MTKEDYIDKIRKLGMEEDAIAESLESAKELEQKGIEYPFEVIIELWSIPIIDTTSYPPKHP